MKKIIKKQDSFLSIEEVSRHDFIGRQVDGKRRALFTLPDGRGYQFVGEESFRGHNTKSKAFIYPTFEDVKRSMNNHIDYTGREYFVFSSFKEMLQWLKGKEEIVPF